MTRVLIALCLMATTEADEEDIVKQLKSPELTAVYGDAGTRVRVLYAPGASDISGQMGALAMLALACTALSLGLGLLRRRRAAA